MYGKGVQSGQNWRSKRRENAVGSEKGTEFPLSEHKIRSKAGVKPIKTAVCVLFQKRTISHVYK